MNTLNTIWRFIIKSSEDPRKVSLAVKGFGLMAVTAYSAHIIPAVAIACEIGYLCNFLDPNIIFIAENVIDLAGQIVYYALMLVSVVAAFWGTARKAWYTLTGTNAALQPQRDSEIMS